jgi:hypothetical protein
VWEALPDSKVDVVLKTVTASVTHFTQFAMMGEETPSCPTPATIEAGMAYRVGCGTTNNWSDQANWYNNKLPGTNDTVIFSDVSTKDVVIDQAIGIKGITIESSYPGTITQAD